MLFLAALSLIAADPPLPALRVEAAPAGSVLYVRNSYSQPLIAFLVELVDYPGSSFSHSTDEVAVSPEYVKVRAALYSDGSSVGNPESIKQLISRRKSRLETTRELIRRIETSQSNGTAKPGIVESLRQWSASLGPVSQQAVAHAIGDLERLSIVAAVSNLKHTEQAIASSKPALPNISATR